MWLLSIALRVALSAVAGLDFSLSLAQDLAEKIGGTVDLFLSLMMGAGSTFILLGISEFAGRSMWLHENKPALNRLAYKRELEEIPGVSGDHGGAAAQEEVAGVRYRARHRRAR